MNQTGKCLKNSLLIIIRLQWMNIEDMLKVYNKLETKMNFV